MKYCFPLLLLIVSAVLATAQNPPKQQSPEKREDVVVVTTNLVQVDAVVTDKSGRQVTDLRAEDFELLENGRQRQIQAFSYIPLTSQTPLADPTPIPKAFKGSPPLTLGAERPERVRRVIAILVDDFGLSAESVARLRAALEKFVEEQTSPDDLIGVIRASGGPGLMQQFTSNKSQILATIKRIRWYPIGRGRMSAVDSFSSVDNDELGLEFKGYSSSHVPNLSSKEFFPGSLSALGFVIEGLARFPGRKSVVFISDNLPATSKEAQVGGLTRALDRLIERANQLSIVVSTMDARGLPKAGLTADDSQYNLAANQINTRSRDRRIKFTVEQDALSYLAQKTGGIFVHDNNDLNHGLRRIVDSEQGYYLIAYRPDDSETETSQARTYKVTLRLKRPELSLRTRSGFHRVEPLKPVDGAPKAKNELLREALTSPFVREGVRLKMTALFTGGSQIKILLHVDARDIGLAQSSENNYEGSFDVTAVAFDDNGKVAKEVGRTQVMRVPFDGYEQFRRDGFVYLITMPIDRPGPYQVRLALRDANSGRLGSDSQFVEVPNAKTTRLTASGFIVQGVAPSKPRSPGIPAKLSSNAMVGSAGDEGEYKGREAAVRRFATGDLLTYSYLIYGAKRNGTTGSNLLSQIRLFRGDKELFTGNVQQVAVANQSNHEGIVAMGSLRLGKDLPAGEYFMQVIVTDKSAPPDKQTSDEWIDFEIVKTDSPH
jgi:VWFA-related protein